MCTDCGTYLVDDLAVAQAGTDPVPETAGYRDPAFRPPEEDIQARAQTDVTTGMALIGLSVAIPVISYVISFATGGGTYIVSIAPLLYGLYRLNRGLSARR